MPALKLTSELVTFAISVAYDILKPIRFKCNMHMGIMCSIGQDVCEVPSAQTLHVIISHSEARKMFSRAIIIR